MADETKEPLSELLTPDPWEENGYWHLTYADGITGVYHSREAALEAVKKYLEALIAAYRTQESEKRIAMRALEMAVQVIDGRNGRFASGLTSAEWLAEARADHLVRVGEES